MQPASASRAGRLPRLLGAAAIPTLGVAIVAAMLATGGNPAVVLAPLVLLAVTFSVIRIPLRWSATGLVFLILSLEISTDAYGVWQSPLVHLGDLLGYGFSKVARVPVAGFEVAVVALVAVAAFRRASGATVDGTRATPAAPIVSLCAAISAIACLAAMAHGVARGQGVALWKARYILHIPFFFLFFDTAFRSAADFRPIAIAVVVAAHIKALLASYVQLVVAPALTGGRLACATNHGDSILFAMAVTIIVVPVLLRFRRRDVLRAMVLLPLPLWGMVLNDRRLVWAMLAMIGVLFFLATSWRHWKTVVVRMVAILAPIVAAYIAIGWNNTDAGGLFMPVAQIRTMLDPEVDRSTLWRDRENWNIAMSLKHSSPLGIGLGGEYVEYMFNDDLTAIYPDYRGWPHNTILGLLLLAGIPGFVALWLPYLVTVFLALRSERMAEVPEHRIYAYLIVAAVMTCLAVAWGDTGSHFIQYKLAMGLAMALAGKLAVETGAWPMRSRPSIASCAV